MRGSPRHLLEPPGSPPALPWARRLCSTARANGGSRPGRTAPSDWAGRARPRPSRARGCPLSRLSGRGGGCAPSIPCGPLAIPRLRARAAYLLRLARRPGGKMAAMEGPLAVFGERTSGDTIRTQNGNGRGLPAGARRAVRGEAGREEVTWRGLYPPPCAHPPQPPAGKGLAQPPLSLSPGPLGAVGGGPLPPEGKEGRRHCSFSAASPRRREAGAVPRRSQASRLGSDPASPSLVEVHTGRGGGC